jgi:hypothetical protein
MRRILASLLLVLMVAGFAVPLLRAQTSIPACCRRAGQHHCTTPLPQDGFRSLAPSCPYRHLSALTSPSTTVLNLSPHVLTIDFHWNEFSSFESPDVARLIAGNTHKRGPPLS